MAMVKPYMVVDSPNKDNILYVVHYLQKNASISSYFRWLTDEVTTRGKAATRTIIYCQTVKQCAVIYSTLKTQLGENIYDDMTNADPRKVVLEMLHSCTPSSNKQNILESFQNEDGCIKVLVATIAFGMGIDCKKVYRTIHFGPAKNIESYIQESGRAGRDGSLSVSYLVYQSYQLSHVEQDMKLYLKTSECRRKYLLQFFDVQFSPKTPLHLCCDNCSIICKCGDADCKILSYPAPSIEPSGTNSGMHRNVSSEQLERLKCELCEFQKGLLSDFVKRDASATLKVFNHPKFILGFSNIQISQVLDHADKLFTIDDICQHVEIWDLYHANKVYSILQKVFKDINNPSLCEYLDELSSDEEDSWLLDDWNDLGFDEELAMLAIDELSQSDIDETSIDAANVPAPVLNAVLDMSFDAVIDF